MVRQQIQGNTSISQVPSTSRFRLLLSVEPIWPTSKQLVYNSCSSYFWEESQFDGFSSQALPPEIHRQPPARITYEHGKQMLNGFSKCFLRLHGGPLCGIFRG